ncbi:hypothetical protein pb186bvf_014532 [Paramecium bursaria]
MGFSISKLFDMFHSKEEQRLLMVGLDAAGKTTILYKLKLGEVVSSVPTIGFNVENVEYKNIRFTMWDIGGQDHIRRLWRHYYQGTQALIFVMDSSDKERIELAREELMRMLGDEELQNCPVLILANKMDMAVLSIPEMTEKLGLSSLRREWYIQGTCAITGDGLFEGLDWMVKALKNKKRH